MFIILGTLIILSAFFSSAETAMMALNRYRLRHQARKGHRSAQCVMRLLERPDRLLGIVLLGNQFANILASSVATVICIRYFGDMGVIVSTISLTFVILIFGETAPKTVAVLYPLHIAYVSAWILRILLWVLYPFVWTINTLANGVLMLFGIKVHKHHIEPLTAEELRTLLLEGSGKIANKYQHMLLRILDLEQVTVEDVMVPRNEIYGIDLQDDWGTILKRLRESEYGCVPLYEETIDRVKGLLDLHYLIGMSDQALSKNKLLELSSSVYFVPEVALLNRQLVNFQNEHRQFGLVVDEYGEVQGVVTLRDVLEEIVGEFTDDDSSTKMVRTQRDDSVIVDASITIRELNRVTDWQLPTQGPKTLSGFITHYLELIPPSGVACCIHDYPMEIIKANEHTIQLVQVWPMQKRIQPS
jgi:Mg2+/Co2+ transporter CorB